MPEAIIGIDLGTTNSALALIRQGVPTLLETSSGRILPSVVGVTEGGELLVGTPARNQWVVNPERTVRSVKRKMGTAQTVAMSEREYSPQEISALILKDLKASAEKALGQEVTKAVITVPAYFSEVQRQATIEAGEIAGLTVERVINEPTAAALAYGLGNETEGRILVYDLGGGTFDVSVIELMSGVLDVRATAGDNHLGGDDFDERLAEMLADEFCEEHSLDPREHTQAWVRLLRAAEEAKIALSDAPFADVKLEYLMEDASGKPLHLTREVTREEFEELIEDALQRTLDFVDSALEDAELSADELDRVLLVGGSTRIPAVWRLLREHLKQEPSGEIDPDAVVALGAAVQAGIIAGEDVDAILVDVTPMSLGIETAHVGFTGNLQKDRFAPLIRRNTTIPVQKSEVFSTIYPGQDKIHIKVYQGENPVASRNTLLGDFMVEDLKSGMDGLAHITVNFSLDVSGILDVTVVNREGSKKVREQLKANRQRLSPTEIAKSREKLEESWDAVEDDLELDPTTAALLERAEALLANAELDDDSASALTELMDNIREAAREEDEERLEELGDELVDMLMELEE